MGWLDFKRGDIKKIWQDNNMSEKGVSLMQFSRRLRKNDYEITEDLFKKNQHWKAYKYKDAHEYYYNNQDKMEVSYLVFLNKVKKWKSFIEASKFSQNNKWLTKFWRENWNGVTYQTFIARLNRGIKKEDAIHGKDMRFRDNKKFIT